MQLLVLLVLLSACGSSTPVAPTNATPPAISIATPVLTPTSTVQPTSTATPTVITPTATPTMTPAPPTATSMATATLSRPTATITPTPGLPVVPPLAIPSLVAPTAPQPGGQSPFAPTPQRGTAVGDSIMLSATPELQRVFGPGLYIDAMVGRQASEAVAILQERRAAGQLGDMVIVHIGTNGPFDPAGFDEMMRLLAGVRLVVLVNLRVPRDWEAANNALLETGVKRYPNAILADWRAETAGHPEYLADDGYHLSAVGQHVYAQLLVRTVITSGLSTTSR